MERLGLCKESAQSDGMIMADGVIQLILYNIDRSINY